ncbi:HCP-like protein [Lichtheimia hyalospora FSU 10163]|nr:HCP-like protein [Lichtheimia hyalospora FSU 10163]
MDDNDYNQARQPYTPGLETNHRQYPNGKSMDADDDDDDHSDNGTVQPGEGRYTLRVINPDPVSDSSSDEGEEEQEQQHGQSLDENGNQQRNKQPSSPLTQPTPPTTTHARLPLPSPPSAKLEIAAPTFDSNDRQSTTAYVTQFLSTVSSPTTSSLSLASSSAQHTQVTAPAATVTSQRSSSNHDINTTTTTAMHDSSNTITTSTTAPSLNRRQSKTLHEKPGSVELLPPLDLDPLDWNTFTSNIKSSKRLSNIPRVVLGPVSSITNTEEETTTKKSIQDDTSRPTMLMDQEQLVETPLTLTPRTSQSSMQPPQSRYEPSTPRMQPSLLSPSDSGIISASLYQSQRSIATTTHESVLTSTMTRTMAQSKYSKASFSLTNNRDALKLYREMAEKTNDPQVQLSYAKYLLEIAPLYDKATSSTIKSSHHRRESSSMNELVKRGRASLTYHGMRRSSDLGDLDSANKKRALEEEGVRWIRRLAKQHVGEAAYLLAKWMEEFKYGCRPNPTKSQRLHEIAARSGIPESMYATAQHLEHQGNSTAALGYYKDAAEKGLVAAVHRLAEITLHGELGQRQNMTTGLALLAQAADSANETCAEPLYVFAQVLANTYPRADIPSELVQSYGGVDAAMPTFERAAALGHAGAQSYMGYIYEHGLYGVSIDMAKSYEYYDKAAKEGHDASAMLGLARLYNGGTHGPDDFDEAWRCEHDVSRWLEVTGRNEDASFYWCQCASEQELVDALYLLGWYYETGFGTPKDHVRAQLYYQRAVNKGCTDAVARLKHLDTATSITTGTTTHDRRDSQQCIIM